MSEEYEVHGQHDHAVEHAAHVDNLGRWVAMFTAILATMGALISYQNGNAESRGLEYKNEAILRKSEASDQWAYYQAKSVKQVVVEHAPGSDDAERARLKAEAEKYAKEKSEIQEKATELDKESKQFDARSEQAIAPHHRLAQALALVQVAIALAALTVLTRQRWLLVCSGGSALFGVIFWIMAWV